MRLFPDKNIVPVLMFHSVGLENHNWIFSDISEPLDTFERKIKLFKKFSFNTVFWDELYNYMAKKRRLPKNSIMLTFDDGYLDNWVYVFPIIKKYKIKITIFVNPEFVDPSKKKRLNLEDYWKGNCSFSDLKPAGFLNWPEMKEMEESGYVDIQSHSLTHTWYFADPEIVDYHRPLNIRSPYPWLFWNERPSEKYLYLNEKQSSFLKYGYPVFKHDKALVVKKYQPDQNLIKSLTDFVESNGGNNFFEDKEWKNRLDNHVEFFLKENKINHKYESDDEYEKRLRFELEQSKKIIEKNLNKKIDFICWPGGGNNKKLKKLAKDMGYKSWTLSSSDKTFFKNQPGTDPENIKRIVTGNTVSVKGYGKGKAGPILQILRINSHRNSLIFKLLEQIYKIIFVFNKGGVCIRGFIKK